MKQKYSLKEAKNIVKKQYDNLQEVDKPQNAQAIVSAYVASKFFSPYKEQDSYKKLYMYVLKMIS